MHKAQRNRLLTAAQKRPIIVRPRHVRASNTCSRASTQGQWLRCTGLARTTVVIGLINFVQNLRRLATMVRQQQAHATG